MWKGVEKILKALILYIIRDSKKEKVFHSLYSLHLRKLTSLKKVTNS